MQLTEKGQALNTKTQAGKGTIALEITCVVTASSFSPNPLNLVTVDKKSGGPGARVVGVWGSAPQVQSFVNYFNDFAIFFGYEFFKKQINKKA